MPRVAGQASQRQKLASERFSPGICSWAWLLAAPKLAPPATPTPAFLLPRTSLLHFLLHLLINGWGLLLTLEDLGPAVSPVSACSPGPLPHPWPE